MMKSAPKHIAAFLFLLIVPACSSIDGASEGGSGGMVSAGGGSSGLASESGGAGAMSSAGDGSGGAGNAGSNGGAAGTGVTGGGSGGSAGGGSGVDASIYDPCADKACGDACSQCDPNDRDCVETDEVKTCDAYGACIDSTAECPLIAECDDVEQGDDCSYSAVRPATQCCLLSALLTCAPAGCNDGPGLGTCFGTFELSESILCSGYRPCAGKACGEPCEVCDPSDPTCVRSDALKTCDTAGACVIGGADCTTPQACEVPGDPAMCPASQICCAVGRCGTVAEEGFICEPLDLKNGLCPVCDP